MFGVCVCGRLFMLLCFSLRNPFWLVLEQRHKETILAGPLKLRQTRCVSSIPGVLLSGTFVHSPRDDGIPLRNLDSPAPKLVTIRG